MEYEGQEKEVQEPKYECLLFDVDDTLYPFSSGISALISKNISEYMIHKLGMEESTVPKICLDLYISYGTTLAGLRAIGYNIDYEDYNSLVHGILPYEILKPDPVLRNLILSLPYRKVVFSNADSVHVSRVLHRLGLEDCFESLICFDTLNPTNKSITLDENENEGHSRIADHSLEPNGDSVLPKTPIVCKPFEDAYEQAFKIANINPQRTLFFDDSIRNLQTAKLMGLHTVLVGSSNKRKGVDYALESIHNIKEAMPELWKAAGDKSENMQQQYSGEAVIETCVRA